MGKKLTVKTLMTAFCLLAACILATLAFAASSIVTPKPCELVANRNNFPVRVGVEGAEKGAQYWAAIATVQTDSRAWAETLELFERLKKNPKDKGVRSSLEKAVKAWKPVQFWPKFLVSKSPHTYRLYDGGQNPLSGVEPQPMLILVVKVDQNLHERIKAWFRDGEKNKWPGFSADDFAAQYEIVARTEIFLP
ncbi:MAG: hypothetical protein HZB23_04320 [Deltaproteobacteria bacterium]|nr:hypothetical protein [Deltaproteobacteria bacterium]